MMSVTYDELNDARNLIYDLRSSLTRIFGRDPDQEISAFAFGPIDAALKLAAGYVGDHPVVKEIRQLFSPEAVAEGREIRVVEVLPVVEMLNGILARRLNEMHESPESGW